MIANPVLDPLRRAVTIVIAIVVTLGVLTAAAHAARAEKVALQLRWDHQFQFAGYYAALWNGYYADAGLDVEIHSGIAPDRSQRHAIDEVVSGRAQFGIAAADLLVAHAAGRPVVVVASIFQRSPVAVFVRRDAGIAGPRDLAGRRVRRIPGDMADAEYWAMMRAEGIDPDRVNTMVMPPTGLGVDLLKSGAIDAFAGFTFSEIWRARGAGIELRRIDPNDYGVDFYGDTLFTSKDMRRHHPDVVRRFRDATVRGWQYVLENPLEIAERIAVEWPRTLPIGDRTAFERFLAVEIPPLLLHPIVKVGNTNPTRWRNMHRVLRDAAMVDGGFDEGDFIFDPEREEAIRAATQLRWLLWAAGGGAILLIGSVAWSWGLRREVSRRTRQLSASEERYALAVNGVNEGIWDWNFATGASYLSPRWKALLGYTDEELPNARATFIDRLHADDRTRVEAALDAHLREGAPYAVELRLRCKDGTYRWFLSRGEALRRVDGTPFRVVGFIADITERIDTENRLRASQALLTEAQRIARLGYWRMDRTSGRLDWSDEVYRIFDIDPAQTVPSYETFIGAVHPDDRGAVEQAYADSLSHRRPYEIVYRAVMPDGRHKWLQERIETTFADDGTPLVDGGTVQDVTDVKRAETQLQASLREKETLLREVHHRVKNNLQMIASLVYFEARKLRDPDGRAVLGDFRDRLKAMTLVHERLYKANDLSRIGMGDYLASLIDGMTRAQRGRTPPVIVTVEADPIELPIGTALPCGLIVTELVTNAIKHAYPSGAGGTIEVRLARRAAAAILSVADHGVGLPGAFDADGEPSFGWRLIRNLAEQIDGTVTVARDHGTLVSVSFRIEDPR